MQEILQKLVAFRTVTGDRQAAHELIEYVAGFVAKRGMHVERFISNGFESIVATTVAGDKAPTVMLGAHADVVAASDEQFELRKVGDKLYGRGVLDMKFALAAYLQIIDDLQDQLHLYSIGLMVTCDEEIGGADGVYRILQEGYRPQIFILPDGGDNWQVQTGSKGILSLKVITHGKSAHSSRPWEGDNAVKKLLDTLPEIEALATEQKPDSNLVTITGLSSGRSVSQIPNRASATIDIRTMTQAEHDRLFKEVKLLCKKHSLEMDIIAAGDPTHFDLKHPLIAPYVALIEEVTGISVVGSRTMATSDARFLTPYGLPCISLYPTGGDHHSSNEWISIQAFEQFKQITAQYINDIAKSDKPQKPRFVMNNPILKRMKLSLRKTT